MESNEEHNGVNMIDITLPEIGYKSQKVAFSVNGRQRLNNGTDYNVMIDTLYPWIKII